MAFGDSDLDIFFSDMGVPVVFGTQTARGLLDTPGHEDNMRSLGGVSGIEYALTYKTTAFTPAPIVGNAVTVKGVPYIIRDIQPIDDGALTKALLKTR